MDFISGLNPQQQEAVAHVDGPLLILAGAGSGKTRVVTHRISHLISNHGVAPESILAVTFTNKAASEMRDRVAKLLKGAVAPGRGPNLFTFHSFCVRLLRRDGSPLADLRPGFTRQFLIYDDDDQLTLLKSLYKRYEIDDKVIPPRQLLSLISAAKNRREGPEELLKNAKDEKSKYAAKLYEHYNDALVRANAFDFDDLLLETVRLLKHHAPTRDMWQRRVDYLMIDEYQDTNRSQYELVRLLTGAKHNVCAVGDEDQSIYSWRGADIRNILDFERDFPNAVTIRLEQNYRSTKNILEAASAVISNNKERKGKWLWTESAAGNRINIYEAADAEQEALYIADNIERVIRQDANTRVAVLYRTNSQSRQIEEALRRYRRAYKVIGGLSFYQRAEIKDVLAYLKLLLVPTDMVSLTRIINVPARGIGKTTVDHIQDYANQQRISTWDAIGEMLANHLLPNRAEVAVAAFRRLIEEFRGKINETPLHVLIDQIVERTGYRQMLKDDRTPGAEARIENLNELLNAAAEAAERGEGLDAFLDHAALVADADQVDERAQVSLLTVHNAKGLEFPVVFLAGMEEKLFPHSRSLDSISMMEEERRLCYVGMTRAEQRLFVTYALARRRYGGGPLEPSLPSRFVDEIPEELCDITGRRSRCGPDQELFNGPGEVDLFAERHYVRESVKYTTDQIRQSTGFRRGATNQFGGNSFANPNRPQANSRPPSSTPYPGKTYNSVENIAEFFRERGIRPPGQKPPAAPGTTQPPRPAAKPAPVVQMPGPRPVPPPTTPLGKKKTGEGSTVNHPKYGRGTIVRKEGEGDDAKLTVIFPGHGMKKLIAKYAGLKTDE
ncbi:MAG: UvrD-helicase domain-containing protein [Bryobacterales bacterium]|nr:UvrD-helicase domain-containing protein [Bryobacterales bacterium]